MAKRGFYEQLIRGGGVVPKGSIFAGKSYQRTSVRFPGVSFQTWQAEKEEQIRLAYAFGWTGGSWVLAVKKESNNA